MPREPVRQVLQDTLQKVGVPSFVGDGSGRIVWLNDAAKGYFVGISEGEVVYESPSLLVRAVTLEQLLGMKLAAWRDAVDRGDARLLLCNLEGSAEEIWRRVEPFVPRNQIDKASYAFDDLWEAIHGHS